MTMQVGIVGSDGVIIASDTRWFDESGAYREPWDSSKLTINHDCGLVVSRSGKMLTAEILANEVVAATLENPRWIDEIGGKPRLEESVLKQIQKGSEPCQCLVVFTKPQIKLWRFQIVRIGNDWGLHCDEVRGKVFAGDCKNLAMFWIDKYYPRNPKVPINQLVPLVAQFLITAHSLNTSGIDGLEIVLCSENGIHRVADEVTAELEIRSRQREESIGAALLSEIA